MSELKVGTVVRLDLVSSKMVLTPVLSRSIEICGEALANRRVLSLVMSLVA